MQTEIESYVLGLLSPAEEEALTTLLQHDPALQEAVSAERQIGERVRGTLQAAGPAAAARLAALMPPPPQKRPSILLIDWQQRAAALALLMLLAFGATFQFWKPELAGQRLPGSLAATATQTQEPTATATATRTGLQEEAAPAVPAIELAPQPLTTPRAVAGHTTN